MLASELVNRLQSVIKNIGDREILVDDKEINGIMDVTTLGKKHYNLLSLPKKEKLPM
jgi:hypothetical protein